MLDDLLSDIRACRICRDDPQGEPLAHEPRPVLQAARSARILIAGQAPGTRVHRSGRPFTDPSGDRLRQWMGVDETVFYDAARIAIVPMGFCFPGLNAAGGDKPPRRECAGAWRERVMAQLVNIELVLLVGQYAQRWHLRDEAHPRLSDTVRNWRAIYSAATPRRIPLPHPSWRNNAWLAANPWFASELLPLLRTEVARLIA